MTEADERGDAPRVHTSPEEGHPAGRDERSDRDVGGPTDPAETDGDDVSGGAPGTKPGDGFDSH